MFSFRRVALVLALSLPVASFTLAQAPSPASDPAPAPATPAAQDPQSGPVSPATQEPQAAPAASSSSQTNSPSASQNSNAGLVSVQARIRARREARRAAAMRDVYSHLYEVSAGMGYLRFVPGPNLQRTTYYAWDAEFTRYYGQRLGVTLDGRGYYGTAFVGINQVSNSSITRPAISTYAVMLGPTYRFYMQPKYSVAGRVMGGYAQGNFSGDTNGFGGPALGLYADGGTYAINASVPLEYNLSPELSLRLAPEYMATGFGSKLQNSLGFTTGVVFRFGKQ